MGEPASTARRSTSWSVIVVFAIALLVPVSAVAFLLTAGRDKPTVSLDLSTPCGQLDATTIETLAPGGIAKPTETRGTSSTVTHCSVDTTGRDVDVDVQADASRFTAQWRSARCREVGSDPARSNRHVVCRSQRRDAGESRLDTYVWVEGVYQVHAAYQLIPAGDVPSATVAAFDDLVERVVAALPAAKTG